MKNPADEGGASENHLAVSFRQNPNPIYILDQALQLATAGYSVFPCKVDKSPACLGGFKDASRDPETIKRLFSHPDSRHVGVPTGDENGIAVLDCDVVGLRWYDRHKSLLQSFTYQTPSGGFHVIYRNKPGLKCSAGKITPGIDVRASGGYVIWWPCSGYPIISQSALADWPEWVFPLQLPKPERHENVSAAYIQSAFEKALNNIKTASSGNRNDTLNREAHGLFRLIGEGLPSYLVIQELRTAATLCGLSAAEVERTLESAAKSRGLSLLQLSMPNPLTIADHRQFKLIRADQLEDRTANWLIKGLIERVTLAAIIGDPGSGKSFLGLLISYCIAAGQTIFGRTVTGWLRAAVLGANDGIISVSSLMIGIASAEESQSHLAIAGITGLVAGAMSMAAGEYVSVSSQADLEQADLAREGKELVETPGPELDELTQIYVDRGVEKSLAREVSVQMMKKDALGVHAREELGISEITTSRPLQAAIASASAFSIGAIFPVIAAFFIPMEFFVMLSSVLCIALLGALGAFAARTGGASMLKPALRIMFWGAVAMGFSAVIGHFMGVAVG